jgi:four helix bundle protein
MLHQHGCKHESLHCYQLLVQAARWFRGLKGERRDSHLLDQGRRASESAVLNLAEGSYRIGKDRVYHLRVAQGSAAEAVAVLDLLTVPDAAETQGTLRRAVAMMEGLR